MSLDYYRDPGMAELYDRLCAGRSDLAFYLPLMMESDAVLDIGCGTGLFLHQAREAGHSGRLCGLDPSASMLTIAQQRNDIEWKQGFVTDASFDHEFSLAIMTGHAFQFLVTDAEITATLSAIYSALRAGGQFIFETRNPARRAWDRWNRDYARQTVNAEGETVTATHDIKSIEGDTVTFTETFSSPDWTASSRSNSTLRFLTQQRLTEFIAASGLTIEAQYGDFDHSPFGSQSPEIITVATRT